LPLLDHGDQGVALEGVAVTVEDLPAPVEPDVGGGGGVAQVLARDRRGAYAVARHSVLNLLEICLLLIGRKREAALQPAEPNPPALLVGGLPRVGLSARPAATGLVGALALLLFDVVDQPAAIELELSNLLVVRLLLLAVVEALDIRLLQLADALRLRDLLGHRLLVYFQLLSQLWVGAVCDGLDLLLPGCAIVPSQCELIVLDAISTLVRRGLAPRRPALRRCRNPCSPRHEASLRRSPPLGEMPAVNLAEFIEVKRPFTKC